MTARKARPYGLDNKQMEQLWQVAIKAFVAVQEIMIEEIPKEEMIRRLENLDSYLANDVDEELWLKMQEYVETKSF